MTTTRTPIAREGRMQITPVAIAAFRKMQRLETKCTCAPVDWNGKHWERTECPACKRWWEQHSILWDELGLRPWQWPAYRHPDATVPYPEGSYAARTRKPDLEAQERYGALVTASKAST